MHGKRLTVIAGVALALAGTASALDWIARAPMANGAQHGIAVVAHDGKIYVLGNGVQCEVYDPAGDSWSPLDDLPFSCHQGRAVSDGTYVYLAGGENRTTNLSVSSLYRLDPTAAAGSQWTQLSSMSTAREGHGAAIIDGTIYVFGGLSSNGSTSLILDSVEAYDIAGDTWTVEASLPYVAGFGVSATAVAGKVYLVGGLSTYAAGGWNGKTCVFDPAAGTYTLLADMPVAKTLHGAAAVNGSIIVSGGMTEAALGGGSTQAVSTVEAYDPVLDAWTTLPDLPAARAIHDSTSEGGIVYVIGGTDENGTQAATCYAYVAGNAHWMPIASLPTGMQFASAVVAHDAKVYALGGESTHCSAYDPTTGAWSERDATPYEAHKACAVSDGTLIYLMAGIDNGTAADCASLHSFDPNAVTGSQWTQLASMSQARHSFAAVSMGGTIYVFGGDDGSGVLDSVEAYDTGSDVWSTMTPLPSALGGLGAAVVAGDIYVFGGGTDVTAVADVYLFDPAGNAGAGDYTAVASMPTATAFYAVATAHDRAYVIGGATLASPTVAAVSVYDPAFDTWTTGPALPYPRRIHGACSLDNAIFVIAGDDDGTITSTCYVHVADAALDTAPPNTDGDGSSGGCVPGSTSAPLFWPVLGLVSAIALVARRRSVVAACDRA
jgi:N-acetylneuraminic acid mutarotase